jgi:hypothetical protein
LRWKELVIAGAGAWTLCTGTRAARPRERRERLEGRHWGRRELQELMLIQPRQQPARRAAPQPPGRKSPFQYQYARKDRVGIKCCKHSNTYILHFVSIWLSIRSFCVLKRLIGFLSPRAVRRSHGSGSRRRGPGAGHGQAHQVLLSLLSLCVQLRARRSAYEPRNGHRSANSFSSPLSSVVAIICPSSAEGHEIYISRKCAMVSGTIRAMLSGAFVGNRSIRH